MPTLTKEAKKVFDEHKCYKCKHRCTIPGDAHTRCGHPEAGEKGENPLLEMMAIFASVGRCAPVIDTKAIAKLNIQLDDYGISRGWGNWPFNFDPTWLKNCDGFEEK